MKKKDKQINFRIDQNSDQYRWLMNQSSNTKSINILINLAINTFGYGDIDKYFDKVRESIIENSQFVLPNAAVQNTQHSNVDTLKNNVFSIDTNSDVDKQRSFEDTSLSKKEPKPKSPTSDSVKSQKQETQEEPSFKPEAPSNVSNTKVVKEKPKLEEKHKLSTDEKRKKLDALGIKINIK